MPSTPQSSGHRPGDPAHRRITVALFLAALATFAMLYAPQPLLPVLRAEFDLTPAQATLALSVSTVTLAFALVLFGPLSDAVGRVVLMRASLVVSALVALATAFVTDWTLLLVLRGVLGFTLGGLPAVAAAYLREEIEPAFASAATGLYIGGTAAGGMAGRLVSGALSDVGDWRAALGGIGTLAVLCAAAAWALLPASRHWQRVPLRPRELKASARRMFLDRELFTLYTLGFLGMGAFVSVFNGLAFRLAAPPFSLSVGLAGLIYLTNGLGSVSSPIAGRLAGRFGPRAVVIGALLVTFAGVGVTLLDDLVAVVAGAALVTTGFFAAHGTLSGWVSGRASTRGPGTGMAGSLYLSAYYMGSSVCGALAGSAWSLGSWPGVAAFVAAVLVAGLLGAASLRHAPRPDAGVLPPLEA